MTASNDDLPVRSPAELAAVRKLVQRCCEILAAGVEALRPRYHPIRPRRVTTPYERAINEASFACWEPPTKRITWQELLRDPPPVPKPAPPRIPLPLDTWPGSLAEFQDYCDELLDRQEAAAEGLDDLELEAAE